MTGWLIEMNPGYGEKMSDKILMMKRRAVSAKETSSRKTFEVLRQDWKNVFDNGDRWRCGPDAVDASKDLPNGGKKMRRPKVYHSTSRTNWKLWKAIDFSGGLFCKNVTQGVTRAQHKRRTWKGQWGRLQEDKLVSRVRLCRCLGQVSSAGLTSAPQKNWGQRDSGNGQGQGHPACGKFGRYWWKESLILQDGQKEKASHSLWSLPSEELHGGVWWKKLLFN